MFPSLAAFLFLAAYRVFHWIHLGSQVLFEGFWMGILPESAFDIVSERSYGKGEQYSGDAWLDSGLQFFEQVAIARFFQPGRVMIAAAGAGREMIALSRAGFEADGFDCSRPMVEAGKRALVRRGIGGRLEWAPPCKAPEIGTIYDSLIVGWNGYTYISPRSRRIEFLKSLWPHLRPGSPVLVSGAARPRGNRSAVWIPRIANAVRRCTLRDPVFEPGAAFPGRPRHSFSRNQMEQELEDAGFQPAAYYRWGDFCAVVALRSERPPA